MMLALIYEKKGVPSSTYYILQNLESNNTIENFEIQYYKASVKYNDEDYQNAYINYKKCLNTSKTISAYDYYNVVLYLSKTCNELGSTNEQLQYALQADSVINHYTNNLLNSEINYINSYKSTSSLLEYSKKQALINLSVAYRKNKNFKNALNTLDDLIIAEKKSEDKSNLANIYINKGLTYTLLQNYGNANYSYNEALKLYDPEKDNSKICETYNLIAKNCYLSQDFGKVLNSCDNSIELAKKKLDYSNLAASYFILYETYTINNDYINAQKYFKLYNETKEIIEKQKQINNSLKMNKVNETNLLAKKAEADIVEVEKQELELLNAKMLSEQRAREVVYLKQENDLKEKDLLNQKLEKEQIQRNLTLIQEQLEKEQLQKKYLKLSREREIKILEGKNNENEIKLLNSQKKVFIKENELKSIELTESKNKQRIFYLAFLVLLAFVGSLVYFLMKMNKQKKIIELKNQTIEKSNIALEKNIQQVTEQKSIIETKNALISDSINYSQRIQQSLLMPENTFKTFFEDAFIIFLPKETVSGDFYLLKEKEDVIYLAVVDCTGHGVPGAMISTLAYQEIVHLIDTTKLSLGNLLDVLNTRINTLLNSNNLIGTDGMDLIILSINKKTNVIQYSGAKNNFILWSNNQLIELKSDRKSIGSNQEDEPFNFSTNTLTYQTGDILYLYTDGYFDQFSQLDYKRIGTKRFKSKIQETVNFTLEQQKKEFLTYIYNHKNTLSQTDDITLIGVKL